ncbi:hypothetical protein [Bacillus thuringiensis]|uniref:hypothetical protein n=1 Tax=Bacillus thuringiensis TaxID=1428 RepID=UPI0021B2E7B7|nr:hypothetical protein [Bacillus thuringiensis]
MIVKINAEEADWLHKQNNILFDIEKNPSSYSDVDVKNSFDTFYNTVCSWQQKYPTRHLSMFWAIGAGYDGFIAGNNPSFIGLYRELMDMVEDGNMTKPMRIVIDNQLLEIHEDGTEVVIDSDFSKTLQEQHKHKKKG